jgi:hypothetical protein
LENWCDPLRKAVLAKENFRWKKRKLINLYKMPFISEFSRILYTTIGPSNFSFSWIIWIIQNRWLMAPGRRWKEFGRRKREMNGSASSANNWFEAKQPKNKNIGFMYTILYSTFTCIIYVIVNSNQILKFIFFEIKFF